jgi:uncharacterized protein (UPF0276 family)
VVGVGITFQPEQRYLDLVVPLAGELADYVEVAPETLWRVDASGQLTTNGYHRALREYLAASGKSCVAHGVGLSLGTADRGDAPRFQRWLARIAADHASLRFAWYTDHLGATVLDGQTLGLPVALPMTEPAAQVVRERLAALRAVVPDAGVENSVFYFLLGDWLDEPAFLANVLSGPGTHLVLDLHNVHTMATNLGRRAEDWLDRVDLTSVIEIHVSGGKDSDPAWLHGRTMRLDSHDAAVPDAVWRLLDRTLPRCPNLRGITLERMEGTLGPEDVPLVRAELRRIREAVHGRA